MRKSHKDAPFEEGIAVYFITATGFSPELINSGRSYTLTGNELRVYDAAGVLLRLCNWDHVAILCAMKTIGPAGQKVS